MRSLFSCVCTAVALLVYLSSIWAGALAQDAVEEVVVTGSYVSRNLDRSGSPVVVVSSDELIQFGLTGVKDVINYLPFNAGSEFNADVFTQNLSTGTSNFNLRGLGLNSTLVLLNGRRQTVSGGVADDGSTFVDTNALAPLNVIERIEILKDGAAAIYGTDAVAGVVNVITRTDAAGWEIEGEYGSTTHSSQNDLTMRGLYGWQTDTVKTTAAVSYQQRSWLPSPDRDFTVGKGFSSFGQPGAFILLEPSPNFPDLPFGLDTPQSVIDPNCGITGGTPNERVPGSGLGTCRFDFSPFYHLVPKERRWLGHFSLDADLGDAEIYTEVGYAHTRVIRGTSPSFPILNLVTVPANNPGNVFQTPLLFLGRPLGADARVNLVSHESETWRVAGGIKGTLGEGWDWDVSTSYSANGHLVGINNALADRFNAALNGEGGPNNNQFFNPFGSALTSQRGEATFNDPAVIDDFLSLATYDYETSLLSFEGLVRGPMFYMEDGPAYLALGGQARREEITGDLDDQFNSENYLFFIGGPDFSGNRTVAAVFAELNLPLAATMDLQLAVRHEAYEKGPDSTDPKIAVSWRPREWFRVRGSFGTAFRAPSVFQLFSSQTVLQNIIDPITDSTVFRGVRTRGTDTLKPEQADVFNAGLAVTPIEGLSLGADYWRFDYTDIIVKESAQAIVDANPFDPKIIREAGQILRIETNYINASAVNTDGFDLKGSYTAVTQDGDRWSLTADLTYINKYLIQPTLGAAKQDVSGSRNFRTFARSIAKWRTILGAAWSRKGLGLSIFVKTVSGYFDDQNKLPVNNYVTVDAQARLRLPTLFAAAEESALTLGVVNLLDRQPPDVLTNVGYDSKVHDPRGRVVYLRINTAF